MDDMCVNTIFIGYEDSNILKILKKFRFVNIVYNGTNLEEISDYSMSEKRFKLLVVHLYQDINLDLVILRKCYEMLKDKNYFRTLVFTEFDSFYIREEFTDIGVDLYMNIASTEDDIQNEIKRLVSFIKKEKVMAKFDVCLDTMIRNTLKELGVSPHLIGFDPIRLAVERIYHHPELGREMIKKVYPSIAVQVCTSKERIERNIRTAIEYAMEHGSNSIYEEVFMQKKEPEKHIPTNVEFILNVVDYLQIRKNISTNPYIYL